MCANFSATGKFRVEFMQVLGMRQNAMRQTSIERTQMAHDLTGNARTNLMKYVDELSETKMKQSDITRR